MESLSGIRLFVTDDLAAGEILPLSRDQSHYLTAVMRRKAGDTVRVFNGRDGEWSASLATASKKVSILAVANQIRPQAKETDLWLVFAPIKKTPIDFMAQKATELGVSALLPVLTRNTAVSRVNKGRMAANAREAAEQCGRLMVPEVGALRKLEAVLSGWPQDRTLIFCDEGGDCPPVLEALQKDPAVEKWAILIGPEGGFTEQERAKIRSLRQTVAVSLGKRILRADTAAIAALAVWNAVFG